MLRSTGGSNLRQGTAQLKAVIEQQQPKVAEFYVALGYAWQRSGELGKAAALFDQASRLKPDSVRVLRFLGVGLKESGQLTHSADVLNRAVQIAPDDASVWYELALLDSDQGRKTDAIAKMEKAIALDPDLIEPYNGLGVALAATGVIALAGKYMIPNEITWAPAQWGAGANVRICAKCSTECCKM
jgi:tetratricopeptide (TPR) repeat protein